MTRTSQRLIKTFMSAIALVTATATTFAADYPDRAIKLIVPWAAGGDTDLIFRPLAPLLQKYLGQPIVIANVGGASGTVGEREASGAAPDGYTLFGAHDFIHSVYFGGMIDIKYDAAFEPVCMVSSTPSVITVGAKTPWKTFKELVEDAKKRPDQIVVGASLGSTSQYSIAIAANAAGVTFKYVPYDGTAKRMNALLGGHIDVGDSNLTQKGKVDAGLLRFLANMSEKRTTGLEDVPTLKELGYPMVYDSPFGIAGPKGMDPKIVAKLHDAFKKALEDPAVIATLAKYDMVPNYKNTEDYKKFVVEVTASERKVIDSLGLAKK